MATKSAGGARTKLLDAALSVIRAQGYSAATVDDICQAAGVTKGAFFHHFASKEELAVAAAAHFSEQADEVFSAAPYRDLPDPVDRLLGYVDFRTALLHGDLPEYTCLLGTMVQEAYETHPAIREACEKHLGEHAATLAEDISAAMRQQGIDGEWTAESLAFYTQAVIQGAFILAKAKHGPEVAAACLDHLRRYLEMLFHSTPGPRAARPERRGDMASDKIDVRNINHPGMLKSLDAAMYSAMRKAYLHTLPEDGPGLTLDAIRERLPALLPDDLFPGGARANWWAKTVQLDLEARGVIVRDKSSPLRLRKA